MLGLASGRSRLPCLCAIASSVESDVAPKITAVMKWHIGFDEAAGRIGSRIGASYHHILPWRESSENGHAPFARRSPPCGEQRKSAAESRRNRIA